MSLVEFAIATPIWLGAGIDSARRLAYHWNSTKRATWEKAHKRDPDGLFTYGEKCYEESYAYGDEGERRFGALCIGLLCPPLAYLLAQLGENWDKPPKEIRAAEKRKALGKRIEQLEKENKRYERMLELDS